MHDFSKEVVAHPGWVSDTYPSSSIIGLDCLPQMLFYVGFYMDLSISPKQQKVFKNSSQTWFDCFLQACWTHFLILMSASRKTNLVTTHHKTSIVTPSRGYITRRNFLEEDFLVSSISHYCCRNFMCFCYSEMDVGPCDFRNSEIDVQKSVF